jgi:hypothetical protein
VTPSGEQPAINDQQPPANAEAPLPGTELLPCSGSTAPEEFLQILTDAVCGQVAICRCTADVACDGCATCYDRCRCHGGSNSVCRQACGGNQGIEVSFDWGGLCQSYRDCAAGQGCEDLGVIEAPLPVCPSELGACVAAVVSTIGCSPTAADAEDLSFDEIPACARIAELVDQATSTEPQDAGTELPTTNGD